MRKIIKKIEKSRISTYLEKDLVEWLKNESAKSRISESAFLRQMIAEKMMDGRPK